MFFIVWLTSAMACRVGEAACLRRGRKGDFFLDGSVQDNTPTVQVRKGKSPGNVYIRPEFIDDFKLILKHGSPHEVAWVITHPRNK
jgi:hypothetical protein